MVSIDGVVILLQSHYYHIPQKLVTRLVYMITYTSIREHNNTKIISNMKCSGFGECTKRGIQRFPIIISCEHAVSQRAFEKNQPQQSIRHFLVHLHHHTHFNEFLAQKLPTFLFYIWISPQTHRHYGFEHAHGHALWRRCRQFRPF